MSAAPSQDGWTPSSWRTKPFAQAVQYPDEAELESVLDKIKTLPPLVTPTEIDRLRDQLAAVQRNEAFLLHAGDCAESFDACTEANLRNKLGLILSVSLILIWGARLPIVRVARIAGQYAKPRSAPTEVVDIDGVKTEVPSFRGDNVNGLAPTDRTPAPQRLLAAYFHSAATLNHLRALLASGFASLGENHPSGWSLRHVRSKELRAEFTAITAALADALDFSRVIGLPSSSSPLDEVDFYTSHEGLMLGYEEALTRPSPSSKPRAHYNTSAHFLWIGDRTRQLAGAHVEYFRGIRNPVGVKVGPSMAGPELVALLDILNPDKEPGRITLITRYGAAKVETHLPPHIAAVKASAHPVAWVCDPMHGNTQTTPAGIKTRHFSTIVAELTASFRIHAEHGSRLQGTSLEFTGELTADGFSVTECLGGSMGLREDELGARYHSFCDPRLNFEQSLDLAFLVSDHLRKERSGKERGSGVMMLETSGRKSIGK
ncbi:DAHP synthetase [Neolentinus lepideus HHB14362 ss-1]|uniref:Phospho-2-dehydro-3-deoxyheptonate aldolase n=1 Tax=Neolentinus lepideus HHB14362 ss-1 TaxID=1314782 RepID=A0A165S3S3_9AGAM|nr:DAHP synthetase [Neolentinus lepideus HHB14362 ss-1]